MGQINFAGKAIPKYNTLLNNKISVGGNNVYFDIDDLAQYHRIDIALGASEKESATISIFPNSKQTSVRFLYTSVIDFGYSLIMIIEIDLANNRLVFRRFQMRGWPDDVGGVYYIAGYYK